MGPYGPKIAKSVCFNELGEGDDDTWLGGGAPRRRLFPHQKRNIHESACPHRILKLSNEGTFFRRIGTICAPRNKSMTIHHPIKPLKSHSSHKKDPNHHAKECSPQGQTVDLGRHDGANGFIDPGQGIDERYSLHDRKGR